MNAAETAENSGADVSYHEILNRTGISFRLGVFGTGIKVGGVVVIIIGGNNQPAPDPALGLRVGAIMVVGSALLAIVLRWYFQRTHRDRSDRSHSPPHKTQDYQEQSGDRSAADEETESEAVHVSSDMFLSPETLGEAFGALFAASVGFLFLSLTGFMIYVMLVPGASLAIGVAALAVSWVGIAVSLSGYSVWSARQLRQLPRDSDQPTVRTPVRLLAHVIPLLVADPDGLNAYDSRLRRTTVAFLLAAIALSAPLLAQIGGLGRFPGS
ncbi:hypothetical protein [Halorussus amylolyticus]|uniref:hypothetical protein n=1 Tax=Halorussus amylolyticus TaxID=1126242 RepID=UPI001046322B|nr:hypothetical protein [Halorussus amylolyticus]